MPFDSDISQRLLNVRIQPRDVVFYYILKSEVDDITTKTFISEIFLLLASLMSGAFLSTLITCLLNKNIESEIMTVLHTLKWVFLIISIIFIGLATFFLISRDQAKKNILKVSKPDLSITNNLRTTTFDRSEPH